MSSDKFYLLKKEYNVYKNSQLLTFHFTENINKLLFFKIN